MPPTATLILDLFTCAFLLFGLFFMTVGALGIVRMPDVYHRMHAATKGVTLGIVGMLVAGAFALIMQESASPFRIVTLIALVILFQFVANPVGAHMLAKAGHLDGCPRWDKTLSDELEEDRAASN
jgi:multicomponent Na+:H+ antiporter subunit G